MEMEELKKAWEELNSRVTKNELTNQRILTDMLTQRKESVYQYVSKMEKIGLIIFIFAWTLVVYCFFVKTTPIIMSVSFLILILVTTVFGIVSRIKWRKIKKWSDVNIEEQLQAILEYNTLRNWTYIVVYILTIPITIAVCYYYYPLLKAFHPLWGVLYVAFTIITVVIGVCMDYFLYHSFSNKLKDLSKTIRELNELKKELG